MLDNQDQTRPALIESIILLQKQIEQARKANNLTTVSLQQEKDCLTTLLRESEEQAYLIKREFEQASHQLRQHYIREKRQQIHGLKQLKQAWAKQLPANC